MNTAANNVTWTKIPIETAAQHRLFGVSGWLLFFLAMQSLGTIYGVISVIEYTSLATEVFAMAQGLTRFWFAAVLVVSWLGVVYSGVAVVMGFTRHAGFPTHMAAALGLEIASCLLGFKFINDLAVHYGLPPAVASEVNMEFAIEIVACALLLWYYRSSARVRVTYLLEVRPDDPYVAALAVRQQQQQASPAAGAAQDPAAWPKPPTAPPAAPAPTASGTPAAAGTVGRSLQDRLLELKTLYERGLIDEASFKQRQAAILQEL